MGGYGGVEEDGERPEPVTFGPGHGWVVYM